VVIPPHPGLSSAIGTGTGFVASLDKRSCHLLKMSRADVGFGETLEMNIGLPHHGPAL